MEPELIPGIKRKPIIKELSDRVRIKGRGTIGINPHSSKFTREELGENVIIESTLSIPDIRCKIAEAAMQAGYEPDDKIEYKIEIIKKTKKYG